MSSPARLPIRLLSRMTRVNAYGEATAALAAFKACAALPEEAFDSIQEVSAAGLAAFHQRRGPRSVRSLEEEGRQNAQGFWVALVLIEARRISPSGEILRELSFGSADCSRSALPFASPDAWAGAGPGRSELQAHCQALIEQARLAEALPAQPQAPASSSPSRL